MNPFEQWHKVTSDASWKDKTKEDKEAIRKGFVDKYAEGQPDEARKGFEWATRDLEKEVFNDPEFQGLGDDEKRKYVSANLAANKGLKGEALDRFSTVALNKYSGSAALAGMARLPLAANQLRANISPWGDVEKANRGVAENEKIAAREPGLATVSEIATNVALPTGVASSLVAKGSAALRSLPYVGKLLQVAPAAAVIGAETALTSPVNIKGGTPEEQRDKFFSEKTNQFLLGAGAGTLGEAATSPVLKEKLGDAGRWVRGVNIFDKSGKGKVADIADDLLKTTSERFTDMSRGAITSELKQMASEVAKVAPEDAAAKLPEILGKYKTGQTLLDMQGSTPIPDVQTFLVDNFADKASKVANKGLSKVEAAPTEGVSGRFFERYVQPKRVEVKEGVKKAVSETEKAFTDSSTALYKTLEGTNLDVTKEELAKRTQAFLERPDVAPQRLSIEGNPAISNILYKNTEDGATPLTAKNLQEYVQQTFNSLEAVGGKETQAFVEEVLKPSLGPAAAKQVDDVYAQYLKMSADNNLKIATIKEEGARKLAEIKKSNPLIGTLSDSINEAEIAPKVTELFKTNKVTPKHFDALKPDDKKAVTSLVLSDVSDIFAAKSSSKEKVDALVSFYEKYGASQDTLRHMFKGDPSESALSSLFKIAEGADKTIKNTSSKFIEGGGEFAKGLTREATNISSLTISQFDKYIGKIQRQTRKLLRESSIDKQKMMSILSTAENIGVGQNTYKNLWSVGLGARQDALRAGAAVTGAGGNTAIAGEETVSPEPSGTATPEAPTQELPPEAALTEPQNSAIMSSIDDDISKVGIPLELKDAAINMAGVESNFGQNTKNEISSASGPFQIVDKTWETLSSRLESKLGRPLNRDSVQDNLLAATELAHENFNTLRANKIKATESNLYVMHAFGQRDGLKLLRNPNAVARDLVSEDVVKGHPLFFKDAVTADEVLSNARKYFKSKANKPQAKAQFISTNQLG